MRWWPARFCSTCAGSVMDWGSIALRVAQGLPAPSHGLQTRENIHTGCRPQSDGSGWAGVNPKVPEPRLPVGCEEDALLHDRTRLRMFWRRASETNLIGGTRRRENPVCIPEV